MNGLGERGSKKKKEIRVLCSGVVRICFPKIEARRAVVLAGKVGGLIYINLWMDYSFSS